MNPYAAVHAVASLMYNTSSVALASLLFPDRHPDYLEEWVHRFTAGFARAASYMDETTFRRFVDLAIERHGENALRYHPDEESQ